MKIVSGNISYLKQYTDLLQRTYENSYVDESIGLTKECFSKEIFENKDTQKYLNSRLVSNKSQKCWLVLDGEKLVGSMTCILLSDDEAELTGFYVDPTYQEKGIGKKLYELALNFAKERDLVLDIYAHNTKTIEMYKKWGWKVDKTKGNKGYFSRHWVEWPEGVEAKAIYMRFVQNR